MCFLYVSVSFCAMNQGFDAFVFSAICRLYLEITLFCIKPSRQMLNVQCYDFLVHCITTLSVFDYIFLSRVPGILLFIRKMNEPVMVIYTVLFTRDYKMS